MNEITKLFMDKNQNLFNKIKSYIFIYIYKFEANETLNPRIDWKFNKIWPIVVYNTDIYRQFFILIVDEFFLMR